MRTRLIIIGALAYTVASVLVSIFVFKPAKPIIDIKGEKLASAGPLDITNTLFTAWVVMFVVIAFWFLAARKKDDVPTGLQNLGEAILEAISNFVTGVAGEKNGRRFFPLIATLLIYIVFANWLSLTPLFNTIGIFEPVHTDANEEMHERAVAFRDGGVRLILPGAKDFEFQVAACATKEGHDLEQCRDQAVARATADNLKSNEKAGLLAPYLRGINTDLMTPASFAIVSVVLIEYWGITSLGFFKYMGKFVNFRSPIDFFVGFLETIAEAAKLISFSFRLFGNMLAGEILLLVMTFLVALASPIMVLFYGLELFVGAIQAFVFGALTLVFASQAVSHHGPEEHAEAGSH